MEEYAESSHSFLRQRALQIKEENHHGGYLDNTMFANGQPVYNMDDESSQDFADERFGLFVFLVAGSVATVLIVVMFVREFYWHKYGVDVCPGTAARQASQQQEESAQIDQDRVMAEELQRRLNDEEREAERQAKRQERLKWYESFIQPFTFVSNITVLLVSKWRMV